MHAGLTYSVDAVFMSFQRRGWGIHAVSAGQYGAGTGVPE